MSSPREREKRDRRDRRDSKGEGQGRKRKGNESAETEEIKIFPSTLTCYKDSKLCPTVSRYQLDAPVTRYTTPRPHLTSPGSNLKGKNLLPRGFLTDISLLKIYLNFRLNKSSKPISFFFAWQGKKAPQILSF